jgi:hypothetical protein
MAVELKKREIHLVLRPTLSPCYNFKKEEPVTVVITPVAVAERNGDLVVSWACSLGPWCPHVCRYSKIKKEQNKDF